MKKIEIVETFGRYKKGQVVVMNDFDTGHALAFKYGRIYVDRPVETQAIMQPETRLIEPENNAVEKEPEKQSFFKRRGRKPKIG